MPPRQSRGGLYMYDKMNRIVVILLLYVLLFSFTIDHKIGNNNLRRMIMRIVLSHHEKMEIGNWQHVIKEVISKILDSILKKKELSICVLLWMKHVFFFLLHTILIKDLLKAPVAKYLFKKPSFYKSMLSKTICFHQKSCKA